MKTEKYNGKKGKDEDKKNAIVWKKSGEKNGRKYNTLILSVFHLQKVWIVPPKEKF